MSESHIPCLHQDYEDFMQSAGEHGVIVFSLGITGYEALSVPDDYIDAFINVFGRLKQKVTSFGPVTLGDISPSDGYGQCSDRKSFLKHMTSHIPVCVLQCARVIYWQYLYMENDTII